MEHAIGVIDVLTEPLSALCTESQVAIHAPVLVVASEEENLSRILQFEGKQEADHLQTLTATIDVIAQEDIVKTANISCLLWCTPNIKEPHQTIVVTVDVSENLDRRL